MEEEEYFKPNTLGSTREIHNETGSKISGLDLSETSGESFREKKFGKIIACCGTKDLRTLFWQCICICPCVIIVSLIVLGLSILISFLVGRESLREKYGESTIFYSKFIHQHVKHAQLGMHSIAEMKSLKAFMCNPKNISKEHDDIDRFLYGYVQHNYLFLHHIRVVRHDGLEINRIDIEHNDTAIVSSNYFWVNGTTYHNDFLAGKSQDKVHVSKWRTHGPLPLGSYYDFYGKDIRGDHQWDHIEYLPLPQIVRVQKAVKCNETYYAGYVISNIRMVVLLNEIDATTELYTVIIISEEGDYVFFNKDRTKEFQSKLGMEQTLYSDWGIGSDRIRERLFKYKEYIFSVGTYEFLCDDLFLGENVYKICIVLGSLNSLAEQPVPIVVGIIINIGIIAVVLCCYFNFQIRKHSRKYEGLIASLYPKEISKHLLRGKKSVAHYQPYLVIVFADIVSFVNFNESFNNDPKALVVILGTMIDVVDCFASSYDIHKIKTIGDCYFGVAGLDFKKAKNELTTFQRKKNAKFAKNVLVFSSLVLEYFRTRRIQFQIDGGKEIDLACPEWRFGVSFGGAISGVLNQKTPYFDLWGKSINLAARMESSSIPGRIQVSRRIYELCAGYGSKFQFQERKNIHVKGFGSVNTYFAEYSQPIELNRIINKMEKSSLRPMKKIFVKCLSSKNLKERVPSMLSLVDNNICDGFGLSGDETYEIETKVETRDQGTDTKQQFIEINNNQELRIEEDEDEDYFNSSDNIVESFELDTLKDPNGIDDVESSTDVEIANVESPKTVELVVSEKLCPIVAGGENEY